MTSILNFHEIFRYGVVPMCVMDNFFVPFPIHMTSLLV